MKKTLSYATVMGRQNILFDGILGAFLRFASYPRLLIEVFTREKFGERYFRLSSAVTIAVILAVIPIFRSLMSLRERITRMMAEQYNVADKMGYDDKPFVYEYFLWYAFLIAFIGMSIKHHLRKKRKPSVFNFKKYSLSSGKINPIFYTISLPFMKTTTRNVECFIEPGGFFILGIFLLLIGQNLGGLLIVVSIMYSLSYLGAYRHGDNYILDIIDKRIINEEMDRSFVQGLDEEETRGFSVRGNKPDDINLRRKMLPVLLGEDEIIDAE